MQDLIQVITNPGADPGGIALHWADGQSWSMAHYWLRDNCHCPLCRHPGNGQKLYEMVDLPANLTATEACLVAQTLRVVWSDGHASEYSAAWLAAHELSPAARARRANKPQLWDRQMGADLPIGDWPQMLGDPAAELAWLERYAVLGFGVLKNVAREPGTVAQVGDRLGFVRVTNYGRLFDVKSVPNPTNLAYTAVGLGVHSDNPYRHPSPGVQLLHCLEADAPGGDTLLVDGFHAAEILRAQDPDAFELLTRVPMIFRYADATTELVARQTLISTDADGVVRAVHFNNRSADWLDAPADVAARWYSAYITFAHILKRPELELIFRLNPGDCVVMQNDRTLHGRTAFDPSLGKRHLQGCYIDGDALDSRRLVLRREKWGQGNWGQIPIQENARSGPIPNRTKSGSDPDFPDPDPVRLPERANALDEIQAAFARRGHEGYGEGVSQLDHAIQCAAFAERDGAPQALVAATFLHDIGHLLHDLPQDVADSGIDTQHESVGSAWLSQYFGPEVTEPVRLHVAAKRYLASVEPGYFDRLSDASRLSLKLQGGPMDPAQARAFEAQRFFADAVRLRRWDEEGKIVGYQGPEMAHFVAICRRCLLSGSTEN